MTSRNILIAFLLLTASHLFANQWKSVNVSYKLGGQDMSNTIQIPVYSGEHQPPVRGVMQKATREMNDFAHRNQVALISKLDQGRGFSKELLAAAAKAAGRPEIEFAGAIVQGISKQGRFAAEWAAANQKRAIAVILDHSWCGGIGQPVKVPGVPMYFNATYDNMYQGFDRRKLHAEWCKMASGQPCTSVIDFDKRHGHGSRGTTTLTAIWLEEAMMHRVPLNVPVGKAYSLTDVRPGKCGGSVSVSFAMDGKRSYHTNVRVKTKGGAWWIPGPKSAAMYLDWVKKNGGKVVSDDSASIKVEPIFLNPKGDVKTVASALKARTYGKAMQILEKTTTIDPALKSTLVSMVKSNVDPVLAKLSNLQGANDIYGFQLALKENRKGLTGITEYDEKVTKCQGALKTESGLANVKIGKVFYFNVTKMNKAKKVTSFHLKPFKTMAKQYPSSPYGKAAEMVCKTMDADSTTRMEPSEYLIKANR